MKKLYIILIVFFCCQFRAQNCGFLTNGDFDNPYLTSTSGLTLTVNGWSTTATDGLMEAWGSGYNGVSSYNGIQHIELNATQAATMYQDFNIGITGAIISVKFAHRARASVGQTDSVRVEVGPVGGPYTSLGIFGDGPSAWSYRTLFSTLGAAGMYRIRFTPTWWGFGNSGVGNFLDAVSICLEQADVNELFKDNSSLVYPNPAKDNVSIKFENNTKDVFLLHIYDQQGRLVKTKTDITSSEINIERSYLNSGLYFFTLSSELKTLSGKFNFID